MLHKIFFEQLLPLIFPLSYKQSKTVKRKKQSKTEKQPYFCNKKPNSRDCIFENGKGRGIAEKQIKTFLLRSLSKSQKVRKDGKRQKDLC